MKRLSTGIAAAALLLTGCGSDVSDQDSSPAESSAVSTTTSAAETTKQEETSTPQTTDDGFLQAKVDQTARAGCNSNSSQDCDLAFRVTEVQRGYECAGYASPIAEGDETLLVRIEAEMAPNFQFEHSGNVLHSQHWGVIDADGYYIQHPENNYCADLDFDLGRLYPGTKARGALLLSVPEGSKTLRLGTLTGNGGWEWTIPA